MSNNPPFYSDEAVLLSWGESPKDGAWIKLQIREDLIPDLRGLKRGAEHGERFAVVIVGPLASDEHSVAPGRGKAAGGNTVSEPDQLGAASPLEATPAVGHSKPKRRWQDMPASQRAALLTKDEAFRAFVAAKAFCFPAQIGEVEADTWIKTHCGIESKATLDSDPGERRFFRDRFLEIERDFEAFRQARGHGVI